MSRTQAMAWLALVTILAGLPFAGLAVGLGSANGSPETRGVVLAGLKLNGKGPCGRFYELEVPGAPLCTHGPDPAPSGVDVTEARDTAELQSSTASDATVPCVGDGVSGSRVQAVYAVASDRTDRYDSLTGTIVGWAGAMDQALDDSAAKTGGERHIRFVTKPDCSLDLAHVVLSPTGDDNFSSMVTELRNQGFNKSARKYLIWMDATVYCGVAQVAGDDTAGDANRNNTSVGYARVDTACWGRSDHLSELHELMHNLGAVQLSAPHSSGGYHCTDEYDVMCYRDSSSVTLTYPCASSHERLLDCGDDDYFHTSPPAGSYLATRWNSADSVFLHAGSVTGGGGGGGGTGTPELSLARTASPSTYSSVGQSISYGYTVSNSGTASLGPTQLTISDTRVGGGAPFACGASSSLAPGATVSCSASTTVTQADLDAGSISSSATASGGGTSSQAASITVQRAAVATTTTVFSGSLSAKRPKRTFTLTVGEGASVNSLQFTPTGRDKNKTGVELTLRVIEPNGAVVATATGPSVVRLTTGALARGTYTWEVTGSNSVSFSLEVTHTTP